MRYEKLCRAILENIGGEENIHKLSHCMTRMRFNLKDESLLNRNALENIQGVIGVTNKGGQLQVIIGTEVSSVFKEFIQVTKVNVSQTDYKSKENIKSSKASNEKKQNPLSRLLDVLAGVFTPFIPAIVGAGMLKGLLSILLINELVSITSDTYQIFNALSDGVFYFLPIMVAFSSALKFSMNPYVAAGIAATVLYPALTTLLTDAKAAGDTLTFLGITVVPATYAASILPIFFTVWVASYVERFAERYTPQALKIILVPTSTLLIAVPLFLILLGPLGVILGDGLAKGMSYLFENAGPLAGLILGGTFPLIVLTGMHHALIPIFMGSLATQGYDYILPLITVANIAQGAAAIAVSLKIRNKNMKSLSLSTGITALLGVTEPVIYGVNLRLKRPFFAALIGSGLAGMFMMLFKTKAYIYVKAGIQGFPMFIGPTFIYAIVGMLIAFFATILFVYLIGLKDLDIQQEQTQLDKRPFQEKGKKLLSSIYSPMVGQSCAISEVDDITFSSGIMGAGAAIVPEEGKVWSPIDGIISTIFHTKHAIGLKDENGVEILIHIGLETVKLDGRHFRSHIKEGDIVKRGDLLVEFDLEEIQKEGYDTITPIIVTNSKEFQEVQPTINQQVTLGSKLLLIK